jgi:hypothetical protein
MKALVFARVIDVMKEASFAGTKPGMTAEYGESNANAALASSRH